ncbi:LexA family protein [Sphingomonas nostoxanthinifaciens]|uniref:LexA family protein n=1 Tax=Sphingomonas nostoxanthinifaciens TaxID=2872652 RepID=UPI001CC20E99|nr:LexA family transcriptional regulator [Sphingomonas nostoxanthinifaciens]UAK24207.1 LexA family transcriptional regulator [Sphingomonas nostoxanthinifaciens]
MIGEALIRSDGDASAFCEQFEMRDARAGSLTSPTVDRRRGSFGQLRHFRNPAQGVDEGISIRHSHPFAIFAYSAQAGSFDNRNCDYRNAALHGRVDNAEIRLRMKALGLRQADIAIALGIDQVKVSKALTGTRQWKSAEVDELRRLLIEPAAQSLRALPVIGMVTAGNWREAIQNPIGYMPALDPSVPRNAFYLDVDGDSMDLVAPDGSRVLIDPDDKSLFPNRYYVILNAENETTFKQFKADPARLVPCSSNPAYSEIPMGGEPFSVVGRVIWTAARL